MHMCELHRFPSRFFDAGDVFALPPEVIAALFTDLRVPNGARLDTLSTAASIVPTETTPVSSWEAPTETLQEETATTMMADTTMGPGDSTTTTEGVFFATAAAIKTPGLSNEIVESFTVAMAKTGETEPVKTMAMTTVIGPDFSGTLSTSDNLA